ncbi:MAG: putative dehydrogenase [Verrucomicrobiales bacterium]|jgi:predicted dehydrogenase
MSSRRSFLKASALTSLSTGLAKAQESTPSNRVRVGVMGLSRGMAHVKSYLEIPGVEVAYLCDVDKRRLESAAQHVAKEQDTKPQTVTDFRKILEDKSIDALSIAAPNFWHAPATIMACQAGKHVYVEKPGSHNAFEATRMVEVALEHKRVVQMGNQRRSLPSFINGIAKLHEGVIGKVTYARCWYDNARQGIGKGMETPVPDWLDYDLWQGPALERPYKDNLVHYNWHWHWHWGNGELGNNGVHALDIARWGLKVDLPQKVSYTGGRYHFDDDQETPDTGDAVFDFGHCGASWHGSSCHRRKPEGHPFVAFYGEGGVMAFASSGYEIFDPEGKVIETVAPDFSDLHHFKNFIDAIRNGSPLNAPIADAQQSAMLCHLGNIAYRQTATLKRKPEESWGNVIGKDSPSWKREYRAGWNLST